jgi:hypothetical protein
MSRDRHASRRRLAGSLLLLPLAIAGCGSSNTSSSDSGPTADGGAGAATPADATPDPAERGPVACPAADELTTFAGTEIVQTPPVLMPQAELPLLACSYEALQPGAAVFALEARVTSPAGENRRKEIADASSGQVSPNLVFVDSGDDWVAKVTMLAGTTAAGTAIAIVDDVGCTTNLRGSDAATVESLVLVMVKQCQRWAAADEFAFVPTPAPVDLPPVLPDADPLADQGWSISNVSVVPGPAHADVVSATLSNDGPGFRSGAFSLGIFVNGRQIWQGRGPASAGSGAETVVHFFGVDYEVPGEPSAYTYAFRTEATT